LGLRRQQEVRWAGGLACPGHGLAEDPHQPCRLQRCTLATPESRLTGFAQARDWRAVPRHGPTAAVNPSCQSNPSSLRLNNIANNDGNLVQQWSARAAEMEGGRPILPVHCHRSAQRRPNARLTPGTYWKRGRRVHCHAYVASHTVGAMVTRGRRPAPLPSIVTISK
jgi:hypothetical protein